MLTIQALPAFDDNYLWVMHNERDAVVFDPGDDNAVASYLSERQLNPLAILITHEHWDHTDGLAAFQRRYPRAALYAPADLNLPGTRFALHGGESFELLNRRFEVLATPGHTAAHLSYYTHGSLFCGDTLFSAGCGRIKATGSAADLYRSLLKIQALPGATEVYCSHEYTLANLAFAAQVEPHNPAISRHREWAQTQRLLGLPTLPSTLAEERSFNPFLRVEEYAIRQACEAHCDQSLATAEQVFIALRKWKDNF
ncbi:MAG: hydroxyacylglutathione hydrolase [Oceanospirillaceae bacterium]|nr:hydroxyacylglutathione hydrolase [Oceanospirillaceae bacterium]MCP5334435.1 hydroxyacylglutathione hydrolase [Oceanospirillaceae bacterium]MCP5350673.1 hydroxyacylglutathione hydrolase [Oceanospirillaceae bacterium]